MDLIKKLLNEQLPGEDLDINMDLSVDMVLTKQDFDPQLDEQQGNVATDDLGDQFNGEEAEMNLDEPENEDPNRQGLIRTVPNAHLVYKRKNEEGTYEELWIYNIDKTAFQTGMQIRKAILAGTDIRPGQLVSDDGQQSYQAWASGNAEMLKITGLPN